MASKTDNRIYIYDEERRRIIVIDGETGREIDHRQDHVASLLHHFYEEGAYDNLRKFAIWCAHQSNRKIKPIQAKMFALAEKAIFNEASRDELEALYQETEGTAIATDTVGLPQGSANAPAFLASRESINPDPLQAALQAARYHRLWADLLAQEQQSQERLAQDPALQAIAPQPMPDNTEQQQIDHLLDLMNG